MRIAWLCEEMGLGYRAVILPFPTPPDFRGKYPLGSVPFLEDDKVAIGESVAMMLYLVDRYGPTPLLPQEPASRARVLQLTVASEAALGGPMNGLTAARFAAPQADKRNWSVSFAEGQIGRVLHYIANLKGMQEHLAGQTFTLADIAMATTLAIWERALGQATPPGLADWLNQARQRTGYLKARQAFA